MIIFISHTNGQIPTIRTSPGFSPNIFPFWGRLCKTLQRCQQITSTSTTLQGTTTTSKGSPNQIHAPLEKYINILVMSLSRQFIAMIDAKQVEFNPHLGSGDRQQARHWMGKRSWSRGEGGLVLTRIQLKSTPNVLCRQLTKMGLPRMNHACLV